MQSTTTIKGTYIEKYQENTPVESADSVPAGAFSKTMSMEVEPEEYDALVDFLTEPKPIQFSDKAEKAIRKRLEYLERTRGV